MRTTTSLGAVLCACTLLIPTTASAQLRAVPFVTGLNLPIGFAQDPSNSAIQYVVEQRGAIRVIRNGIVEPTPFLDVSELLSLGGERGLLGLAFPADYGTSGRFYIYYTRGGSGDAVGDIVVSRYERSTVNPLLADTSIRKDLIWGGTLPYIEHSGFGNHNGGHMAFGPDGYLYIAVGDGGGGDDPTNNAQNPATFLGKILRIDVAVADSHPSGYVVPPTNPFIDGIPIAALPEIWAFGVRNPWKFSFDDVAGTNALIIADVGQGGWEEVNYEPANSGGRNYGWRNREGRHDNQGNVFLPVPPAYQPLTDPIHEYDHTVGGSITGGFVYRGTALASTFRGRYFFADFIRGRVWSAGLAVNPLTGEATATDVAEHTAEFGGSATLGAIPTFGRDASGELYIVSYAGTIFKIVNLTPPDERQVVLFNYNGDGWRDVLIYNRTAGDWRIHLGNAAGTFDDGPVGGWAPGWKIYVANFNADAVDDLFLYSESTGAWFKVITTGNAFSYFGQGWKPGFAVFIVDFNADGRSDVFLYHAGSGAWFTCISTGAGTADFDYGGGGWNPGWQIFPADFDGDSRSDFLLYNAASGLFFKAITRGNGSFLYTGGGWATDWVPVIAELNGDDRDDVFLYHPVNGAWFRCTSNGDGTGGFAYVMGGWAPGWTVLPADFDNNGRTDFFLTHTSGVWYEAINAGDAFSYYTGGWSKWTIAISDLNADGASDAFLYDPGSGVWYQAVTTGAGAFRYTSGAFTF